MSKLSEAPASSLPGAGQVRMCKCCGAPARCFGTVDFSKSCLDYRGKVFADSGQRVTYYRCEACGFLFTTHIDDWGAERIAAEIYNAEYVRVDPDFSESRPRSNAQLLSTAFGAVHDSLSVLDYGGGDGLMAGLLRGHGFDAQSYDPYHLPNSRPRRRFQLVTAFEVVEHAPDPLATLLEIHSLTEPAGAFLFTTLVQPANLNEVGLDWWYAAPRNGHVSLHTRESLRLIAQRVGWTVESFNNNLHVAWTRRPAWLEFLDQTLASFRAAQEQRSRDAREALEGRLALARASATRVHQCRHGVLQWLTADLGVGRSLAAYGEHAEGEAALMGQLVRTGDTVLEVGAHVGAHTVFLAKCVGPGGLVIAYEPQQRLYELLRQNITGNGLEQVRAKMQAVGASAGSIRVPEVDYSSPADFGALCLGGAGGKTVTMDCVDQLDLTTLRLLRVANPTMQDQVLEGAQETLWRLRPLLYIRVADHALTGALVARARTYGYRCWWHVTRDFNPANFAGEPVNLFLDDTRLNLVGVPEEAEVDMGTLVEVF